MSEIELKLRARAKDFDRLRDALPQLGRLRGGRRSQRQSTVYYETPDFALADSGIALRLRSAGGRRIQAVKAAAPAGGLERGEWEWAVDGKKLDLKRLTRPPLDQLFPAHALATLRPVFRSDVQRSEVEIQPDETTRVAIAFDEGRVVAGDASQPLAEVELELRAPDPSPPRAVGRLYELALGLQRAAPVMISTTSKAELGYRLIRRTEPQARKAPAFDLPRGCRAADGIRSLMRACFTHLLANQEAALTEGEASVEGVHQMRVAVRRLRTALRVFEPFIASAEADWMDGELRWLGRQLGAARDLDVLVSATLPLARKHGAAEREIAAVARVAERRRAEIHADTQALLRASRYTTLALALGAWIEEDRWFAQAEEKSRRRHNAPLAEAGDALLDALAAKSAKAGRHIKRLDAPQRHKLRRSLKRLRYGAEFLAALYPRKVFKRYRRALADLQDVLGDLNDFAAACNLIPALGGGAGTRRAAASLQRCLDRLAEKRLGELYTTWDGFERSKPFWG
jgi:triphosphatase